MGDDTTDEDMFKAVAGEAYTIKVNNGASSAQYTILSQQEVLPFLNSLTVPLAGTAGTQGTQGTAVAGGPLAASGGSPAGIGGSDAGMGGSEPRMEVVQDRH
jgi:hypothetical protein